MKSEVLTILGLVLWCAGVQGQRGPQGNPGARGPTGATGNVGPVGVKGQRGAPGGVDDRGMRGDVGPLGQAGSSGLPGAPGSPGSKGPTAYLFSFRSGELDYRYLSSVNSLSEVAVSEAWNIFALLLLSSLVTVKIITVSTHMHTAPQVIEQHYFGAVRHRQGLEFSLGHSL